MNAARQCVWAIGLLLVVSPMRGAADPVRTAAIIESILGWAVEGRELAADPPAPAPAVPHRNCGGRLDPEHLPAIVYVSWQLSAEGQHAACNWKYETGSHHATPLTPAAAAEATERIAAGSIGPQERAFFHSVPQAGGRLAVTAGYCWGSAIGTFAFRAEGPVLIGELTIHGY
jgi:hypothetical protein